MLKWRPTKKRVRRLNFKESIKAERNLGWQQKSWELFLVFKKKFPNNLLFFIGSCQNDHSVASRNNFRFYIFLDFYAKLIKLITLQKTPNWSFHQILLLMLKKQISPNTFYKSGLRIEKEIESRNFKIIYFFDGFELDWQSNNFKVDLATACMLHLTKKIVCLFCYLQLRWFCLSKLLVCGFPLIQESQWQH